MKALDIKLFRDVRRMWAQVLAIALVVGGGVATLVLAVGSHRSLEETRIAYYERYGFGDVFAQAKRAPRALADTIADIPGVAAVDTRIAKLALLDIPGFSEPASGQFVSLLTTLRLPTFLSQSVAPVAISMNRDNPRHMIRFPGGGSLARAR
ncbi:hypothetical protein [Bradyrhizobium diazoefficiens]|uniref:hypothetical protein n=1 Tax=Bradyrhizobium diazoefficiens TaxID=1355477 RepID=UPI003F733931